MNPTYGTSLGRGNFTFERGQWNRMAIHVKVNDVPGESTGSINVYQNRKVVVSQSNLVFRDRGKENIDSDLN